MLFRESSIKALTDLGLNNLEAHVYLSLLKDPGVTGYRVAKNLGKAVSNVYQALESLTSRGVVILKCQGKDRLYSPVPAREVTARFRSDLERKSRILEDEIASISVKPPESGIYRIGNIDQLFNKVHLLIRESKSAVLITADGYLLEKFRDDLESTGSSDRSVLILGYEDKQFEHCEYLHLHTDGSSPWPGNWIIIDVDGVQHLIAFFEERDTLTHAIWCDDQYMSYWIHFFMMADFSLMMFFQETHGKEEYSQLRENIHGLYRRYSHYRLGLARHYTDFNWLKNRKTNNEPAES